MKSYHKCVYVLKLYWLYKIYVKSAPLPLPKGTLRGHSRTRAHFKSISDLIGQFYVFYKWDFDWILRSNQNTTTDFLAGEGFRLVHNKLIREKLTEMAEARAAVTRPNVNLHAEGTSEKEAEVELIKSTFKSFKRCAFRTRWVIALLCVGIL